MSEEREEREETLRLALKAVLTAAQGLFVDVDELCERAAGLLSAMPPLASAGTARAIIEIENAADALDYDRGG